MFAKPFVGALDGHSDGVSTLSTVPGNLVCALFGACDDKKLICVR